jgi:hypothetical protein
VVNRRFGQAKMMAVQEHPLAEDVEFAGVVVTQDPAQLGHVRLAGVQAVILEPGSRRGWEARLAFAVENGAFKIPRQTLTIGQAEGVAHVLETCLSTEGLDFETRLALVDDIVDLADKLEQISGCPGIMLRIFTEAPTEVCGFHFDTVRPRLPPFGLLKVYNGECTRYVLACDIINILAFYRYLGRRERLSAKWRAACAERQAAEGDRWRAEMRELDRSLPFLRPRAAVHQVCAGAIVAFRHLDAREHWSDHPVDRAWLHCSPMFGLVRLVVNLTPLGGRTARLR